MSHQPVPEETLYQGWSHVATNVLAYPWRFWDVQYQIGMTIVDSVLGMSAGPGIPSQEPTKTEPQPGEVLPSLEQRAAERLRRGLPPPREIYAVPYRDRFNWADFPAWARPIDPDVFEGCSHEG
jgi:hypothetical protein